MAMKINLLREEQMSEKVPHQKNEQMLEFGDSFESGSDDFYFRQPEPGGNEEYKPPRRRRFWVYILILLIVVFAGTYISNPAGTKSYIKDSARNVRNGWYRLTGNIQTWWLDRNNQDDFKTSAPEKPAETKEPEEVKKTEAV